MNRNIFFLWNMWFRIISSIIACKITLYTTLQTAIFYFKTVLQHLNSYSLKTMSKAELAIGNQFLNIIYNSLKFVAHRLSSSFSSKTTGYKLQPRSVSLNRNFFLSRMLLSGNRWIRKYCKLYNTYCDILVRYHKLYQPVFVKKKHKKLKKIIQIDCRT